MDSSLKSFQYIVKFVEDLSLEYGDKHHSLALYNRLLEKTKITHHDSISKHISIFKNFVLVNKNSIFKKDKTSFTLKKISYSEKVFIDFDYIFSNCDSESMESIWKHLLVITNSVDPSSGAIDILRNTINSGSNEGNFLNSIVEKLEKHSDPQNSDPMSAVMSLMNNGVLTELISGMTTGMNDGSLDISKLLGVVQGMMSTIGPNGSGGGGGSNNGGSTISNLQTITE